MSELVQPTRRSLLKAIAGAPLLPLGTLSAGSMLFGYSMLFTMRNFPNRSINFG